MVVVWLFLRIQSSILAHAEDLITKNAHVVASFRACNVGPPPIFGQHFFPYCRVIPPSGLGQPGPSDWRGGGRWSKPRMHASLYPTTTAPHATFAYSTVVIEPVGEAVYKKIRDRVTLPEIRV